jgi:hypothetical protein
MPELRTTSKPTSGHSERRSNPRQKMVLRVGLLQAGGRTSFCLVKNISPAGVQVKLYGNFEPGSEVALTVGDESPLHGRLKWVRAPLAGIEFNEILPARSLLRVTQKLSPSRRRSSPRASLAGRVVLTADGRTLWGELCDISTSGARVRTRSAIQPQSSILVGIPGLSPMRAFVRWSDDDELGLSFAAPIPMEIIAGWMGEQDLIAL